MLRFSAVHHRSRNRAALEVLEWQVHGTMPDAHEPAVVAFRQLQKLVAKARENVLSPQPPGRLTPVTPASGRAPAPPPAPRMRRRPRTPSHSPSTRSRGKPWGNEDEEDNWGNWRTNPQPVPLPAPVRVSPAQDFHVRRRPMPDSEAAASAPVRPMPNMVKQEQSDEEPEEELETPVVAELRRMNQEEEALQQLSNEGVNALNVLIEYRSLYRHDPLTALNIINIVRAAKARTTVNNVPAYARSVITDARTKLGILEDSPAGQDGNDGEPSAHRRRESSVPRGRPGREWSRRARRR